MYGSTTLNLNWQEERTSSIKSYLTLLKYTDNLCLSMLHSHATYQSILCTNELKIESSSGKAAMATAALPSNINTTLNLNHKQNLSRTLKWNQYINTIIFTSRNTEPDCFLVDVCISNKYKSREFSINARLIIFLVLSTTCQKTSGKSCNGSVP